MALFLRGDIWWFEIRTRKVRIVKSTGFRKGDKRKAEMAYNIFRSCLYSGAERKTVESMLGSLYRDTVCSFSLDMMWDSHIKWMNAKNRVCSEKSIMSKESTFREFASWAKGKGVLSTKSMTAVLAREYVKFLSDSWSNKTVRNKIGYLSSIWHSVSLIEPSIYNPWPAVIPDPDGSSRRRDPFSSEDAKIVLEACKKAGFNWFEASTIAMYTGLRYGDIAMLEWSSIDMDNRLIRIVPSKTSRHGVVVIVPMSTQVYSALIGLSPKEGFVFPAHAAVYPKGRLSPSFSDIIRSTGISGYHDFHSWRHTFRSMLSAAGVSDDTARRLGGWTNLRMAAHYDHDQHLDEMRSAIESISRSRS